MRVLAVLLVAVVLSGCVVTVPLRTTDAPSDLLYERPVPRATVERLDSLGRVLPAEIAIDFRFTAEGARWMQPNGAIALVPRSRVHSIEVVQQRGGQSFSAFLITAVLVGGGSAVGFLRAGERDCERQEASANGDPVSSCGLAVFGAMIYSPILSLVSGAVAARLYADRRGPVHYVVTPARR